jgi:NAD(P)-dependent dehydrogenase (short-subunit alcohol dehydrogenase family)
MSTATSASPTQREPELLGQTVVVIGGSAGIGLETARRARAEGANLILTGRNPERLQHAASELDAVSTAVFDATDPVPLERFFRDLPTTIDHVMVTAGRPHYGRLVDMDFAQARRALDEHLLLVLQVARGAADKVRPGGTLLFMSGTGGRHPGVGLGIAATVTSQPTWRSNSRPSESTSSPPASSTRRCRHRSSATNSKTAAISSAPRFPSGASSDRPTSPRSPFTS